MADILGEMADPHVLKNPGMIVFSFANLFGMMGFYVPIIFTVDRAVSFGVPENEAALLLSIMGKIMSCYCVTCMSRQVTQITVSMNLDVA